LLGAELHRRGKRVVLFDGDANRAAERWWATAIARGDEAPIVERLEGELAAPDRVLAYVEERLAIGIIDTPSHDRELEWLALMAADVALIPTSSSPVDRWGLASTIELVEEARTLRPWLKAFVMIARRTQGMPREEQALPTLERALATRVAYPRAIAGGAALTGKSAAAKEVRALADEVLEILPVRRAARTPPFPGARDMVTDPEDFGELDPGPFAPALTSFDDEFWSRPTVFLPPEEVSEITTRAAGSGRRGAPATRAGRARGSKGRRRGG
jgi:chromosome partitioning protein